MITTNDDAFGEDGDGRGNRKGDLTYTAPPFLCATGSIFSESREPLTGKQRVALLSLLTEILIARKVTIATSLIFRVLVNKAPSKNSKEIAEIFSIFAETFREELARGSLNPKRFRCFRTENLGVPEKENRFAAIDLIMAESDFVLLAPAMTKKEMNEFPVMKADSGIDISSEVFYAYTQAMEKSYPMFVVWADGEISENKMIL